MFEVDDAGRIWAVTAAVTVREASLVAHVAEPITEGRRMLLAHTGVIARQWIERWGSTYDPAGRWTSAYGERGIRRFHDSYADKVGGDGWWAVQAHPSSGVRTGTVGLRELEPGWVEIYVDCEFLTPAVPPQYIDDMEVLLLDWAQRYDATYGFATEGHAPGITNLENALQRPVAESLQVSDRVLRGYSWVTYLPPTIATALGGVARLQAWDGAYRVRATTTGGVLIRMTARYADYDEAAIRRLDELLGPVLPPQQPRRPPEILPDDHWDLVWAED